MILINSRFEYFNTFYGCVVGKDYVHNGREVCHPFVPSGKAKIYFKINNKLVSISQLLDCRFLVRMDLEEPMPF